MFDSRDRIESVTLPLGNKKTNTYEDGTNRLLSMTRVDAQGNQQERIVVTLNTIGKRKTVSLEKCDTPSASCAHWTSARSDTYSYSAAGRLSTVTHPDATTVTYGYDSRGNVTSVKDERHTVANSSQLYDALDRLKSVTQKQTIHSGPDVLTQYDYDAQDNQTSTTDPNGNITTYAFDDFRRLQTEVSPVTGSTSYGYDEARDVKTRTDARGAITSYTYDLINRILTASSSKGGTELVTWTYDDPTSGTYGLGRTATMVDPSGTTNYQYERRGHLRQEQRTISSHSFTSVFAYDKNGNRSQITYPATSHAITFGYDYADRSYSALYASAYLVNSVVYEPFGPLKTITFGNGLSQTIAHSTRYLPTTNTIGGLLTVSYSEDAAGNVTALHQANVAYNRDFDYDDLNRLITATGGSSLWNSGSYTYDAMGNLTSLALGSAASTFNYSGTTPKLTSVTGTNGSSVSYDAAGNETQYQAISPRGLVASASNTQTRSSFLYDGNSLRVYSADTISTRLAGFWNGHAHIYSPDLRPLARHDYFVAGGTEYPTGIVTEYVWFADRPVAQLATANGATTIAYTACDHLGTPLLQTNAAGNVIWQPEYDPFGNVFVMRAGDASAQALRFQGQEAPSGAGATYNVFRWYRSAWGRYTQTDPVRYSVSAFRYAYNNPQSYSDPLGLFETPNCDGKCPWDKEKHTKSKHIKDTADDVSSVLAAVPLQGVKNCFSKPHDNYKIRCATPKDCESNKEETGTHLKEGYYDDKVKNQINICNPGSDCELKRLIAHEMWHECGAEHLNGDEGLFATVEDAVCRPPEIRLKGGFPN